MKGFNYKTMADFDLPVAKLSEELRVIIESGGWRRFDRETGETYAKSRDGKLIWEAYGNVPKPKNLQRRRKPATPQAVSP